MPMPTPCRKPLLDTIIQIVEEEVRRLTVRIPWLSSNGGTISLRTASKVSGIS
ncbi:hypothetical protein [Phyllobacterium lublinensis]|uniref:hypothetical protein n=1 Tax=Phyllobacterium lublinensis TaxID=2875708 RepID=UPI001CC92FA7|nr:hypothetical protein [Phyllobacterium sp. 2063]MBZ9654791.1 hypothetical protein [Phyllobacterium sp. 2063]